jgi:hypothetical protein
MNATIVNKGANTIPVIAWMGAMPTEDSLMLPTGVANPVTFDNDLIGRIDCGLVPSNLTRLVHSLPAVSAVLVTFIQNALTWYNTYGLAKNALKVNVTNLDANHGIYAVLGTLANQQVVQVNQTLLFSVQGSTVVPLVSKYIVLRPVGFDQFTGPRGGSIPP